MTHQDIGDPDDGYGYAMQIILYDPETGRQVRMSQGPAKNLLREYPGMFDLEGRRLPAE